MATLLGTGELINNTGGRAVASPHSASSLAFRGLGRQYKYFSIVVEYFLFLKMFYLSPLHLDKCLYSLFLRLEEKMQILFKVILFFIKVVV